MLTNVVATRVYRGPAILGYGFRPFFLLGAAWAALAVPLWMLTYAVGPATLPFRFGLIWHTHEMVFGYGSAIIAGFLLTAVPSWTGRSPISGGSLAALVALWCAGRLSYLLAPQPTLMAACLESGFLIVLAAVIAREIIASGNARNIKIVLAVFAFAAANVAFHGVAMSTGGLPQSSIEAGLAILLILILLIGGRIVPSFTRNWLAKQGSQSLPIAFNQFDAFIVVFSVAALAFWIGLDGGVFAGGLLIAAGVLNIVRLSRWRGGETVREPLVLILHIGYAWAIAALLALGASALFPDIVPRLAGLHAAGAGAIGVMTLSVMTRATLGHTGRDLVAGPGTLLIFVSINLAALIRVGTTFLGGEHQVFGNYLAAGFWVAAFGAYCLIYGPRLLTPRIEPTA